MSLSKQRLKLFSALHLVSRFDAPHFVIESDSKVCIDALKALTSNVPGRLLNFVKVVNFTVSSFGSVSFSWVNRDANFAAHDLASHCPSSFARIILDEAAF